MRKLFIVGHPSEYGGAGSELNHQISLWASKFDLELHIIPTDAGYRNEPLYNRMVSLGVKYESPLNFTNITKDDAVINFCGSKFLENLDEIVKFTPRTIFVNCMTWLFPKEKEQASKNNIKFFLYQRPQVRDDHENQLKKLGSTAEFLVFSPYFDSSNFTFKVNNGEFTNLGRISRQDTDKFYKDTFHIWEYIVSPKWKKGRVLGFDERSEKKTGKPPTWVETFRDHHRLPVRDFWNLTDILVQSTDTNENWPRVGFEAMYSGVPLVVNNKGGWQYMVEHGVTGFLCNNTRDFIYWGSRLAYEDSLREDVAHSALQKAMSFSSIEQSASSWREIFEKVYA